MALVCVDFNRAMGRMWSMPERGTGADLRAGGPATEEDAVFLGTTIETVGVLVHRRIVLLWARLEPWVTELRHQQGRDSAYEWFQWLAERLGERERRIHRGAHAKYRDWRAAR